MLRVGDDRPNDNLMFPVWASCLGSVLGLALVAVPLPAARALGAVAAAGRPSATRRDSATVAEMAI
jgi:hypothetical protein